MRKILFVILIALFLPAAASAQENIFPKPVAGDYTFKVEAAQVVLDPDGVPLEQPTASCGVFAMRDTGTNLLCLDMGPGEIKDVTLHDFTGNGRVTLRAAAWAEIGCTGLRSPDSDNAAYIWFTGPRKPKVVTGAPAQP